MARQEGSPGPLGTMAELKIPRLGLEGGAIHDVKEGGRGRIFSRASFEINAIKGEVEGHTMGASATKDALGNGGSGAAGTFAPTPSGWSGGEQPRETGTRLRER